MLKMLNELAREIHENAVQKGWYDKEVTFSDVIAMCHCELSEAMTEYRDDKPMFYYKEKCGFIELDRLGEKPEGIAVELADVIIRILDYCAYKEIDIDKVIKLKTEYNKTRPYRHGGKLV
jgi:NTP pyrophosphatase (non-canonical NTP hydrolase)